MTAPLAYDIDHARLRVLGAKLPILASGSTIRRALRAPWMTAPLADDIDHARLRVRRAELRYLAAGSTI